MSNLHLDSNMELLKNYLFSEYEKLLSQDITWNLEAFDLLFEGYINSLLKAELDISLKETLPGSIKNGI